MDIERLSHLQPASSRIALCSWALAPDTPAHLIQRLEQLRISAVQLHLNQILDDECHWGDAAEQLRDHGIWVVSGMMSLGVNSDHRRHHAAPSTGILNDEAWYANRFIAEQAARLADRACVGLVCTQIGSIPSDPSGPESAKATDRLGALAEIFANYGINLAIETGQADMAVLDTFLDQVNLPNLGVYFDPAGIILSGLGDPIDGLRRLAHRVREAHIRDAQPARSPGGRGREVPVSRGVVNWDAFFDLATAILPPIHFVIEREPRLAQPADLTAARDLIAYHLAPRPELRR